MLMPTKMNVPERLRWAVEMLDVDPSDQIMEIGCGHGVAAALVCEQLTEGKLVAIDRSEKMINVASERNRACIEAEKVAFQTIELKNIDPVRFCKDQFNKIFAVHVNVFWTKPTNELDVIRELLTPDGALYLFYEPFEISQNQETADKVTKVLEVHRFSSKVIFKNSKTERGVCIIGRPV
jgi:cyclopropane fatty-acyl-phospholipid synthase-like methyltransferase